MTQLTKSETVFVQAETYTKRFVKCPICKDDAQGFAIDYLIERAAPNRPHEIGPCQCKECNNQFNLKIHHDSRVDIAQTFGHDTYVPCLVLLKSTHEKDPIYIMLNTKTHQSEIDLEKQEQGSSNTSLYYSVNTCPTNFMNEIIAIAHEGDTDPHGVFEFVRLLSISDALTIAKSHADQIPLDSYEKIYEEEIVDTFEDHMDLLFPECIGSGNEYEGQIINNVNLPLLKGD